MGCIYDLVFFLSPCLIFLDVLNNLIIALLVSDLFDFYVSKTFVTDSLKVK